MSPGTYGTSSSDKKSIATITAADIINFAQNPEVANVEMFIDGATASNKARFEKYAGRIFRTTMSVTINGKVQTVPVEYVIPSDPDANLAGLTGDILGQQGVASKETYLLDTTVMDRNYYIQYLQQKERAEMLENRNQYLERVIEQLSR